MFEWDEEKNASNVEKHGINFSDAVRIFEGPVWERESEQRYHGEIRVLAVGLVKNREVVVVYTLRGRFKRVISARRARVDERKKFWKRFQ